MKKMVAFLSDFHGVLDRQAQKAEAEREVPRLAPVWSFSYLASG